jgi:hypothetical protein
VREILWRPSEARINASEMKSFMTQLEERFGLTFSGYRELHQWSIDNPELFWDELWFFFDIITSCHYARSTIVATPCPPPIQSDARPRFASRLFISYNKVTRMRAPEAPIGCPMAMAPPLTLTLS